MVDVRRTMPMLLQLRCGDKVQIKANQRSYGFLLLWCREKPADIALNVAHPVDPKLLSPRSGRRAEVAALACIQKQLTWLQETQSELFDTLKFLQLKSGYFMSAIHHFTENCVPDWEPATGPAVPSTSTTRISGAFCVSTSTLIVRP